ncbi:hypothetical protein CEB3_c46430 [Peptococcaceae bacterium CEB3]|nr:hypothetical protein CEB3_c46430 [Peptococcaceae bacterium CEB3]
MNRSGRLPWFALIFQPLGEIARVFRRIADDDFSERLALESGQVNHSRLK